jgi:hypothetical protein
MVIGLLIFSTDPNLQTHAEDRRRPKSGRGQMERILRAQDQERQRTYQCLVFCPCKY